MTAMPGLPLEPMAKYCVILFVDLAGSVDLYGRIGDEAAKAHVLDLQRELITTIEQVDGHVHEVIGDELMVYFTEPDIALACSISLHRCADNYSRQHDVHLQVRIGLHFGTVIFDQDENRMFGDTVNIASRVTNIAQAGQTITTDALVQHASQSWKSSVRKFDNTPLKGKRETMVIYDLPWQFDGLTAIIEVDSELSGQSHSESSLCVSHGESTIELTSQETAFSIGRAMTNDLVVTADSVSRRHVLIERIRGNHVLTDQSTNGTHLYLNNGDVLYLRRQQWPMSGAGVLALGAPQDKRDDHLVQFFCG